MEALKARDSQSDPEEKDPAGGITMPDFCVLIFYPATLLKVPVSSKGFQVESFQSPVCNYVIYKGGYFDFFLSCLYPFSLPLS